MTYEGVIDNLIYKLRNSEYWLGYYRAIGHDDNVDYYKDKCDRYNEALYNALGIVLPSRRVE